MPGCSTMQSIRTGVAVAMVLGAWGPACAGGGHGGHGGGHGGHAAHAGGHPSFSGPAAGAGHGWRVAGAGGAPHHLHNGRWFHGVRGGRFGWWWIAAGAPLVYYAQPGYALPGAYVEPAYGYFCNPLQAYYPEVQSCPEPWTVVVPGGE